MKKLRILALLIVPMVAVTSCTEQLPDPKVNAKIHVTVPILDQLTGFQNTAANLLSDAVAFTGSLDPIANEIGDWMVIAGTAMDTASYYLNIAKEAEVLESGESTVYKYSIFTWSASSGEQTKNVEYQVTTGTDKTVHEVSLEGSKIIEATLDNDDLENGTMKLSFSGNLGSPDYTYEWTQHDAENVTVKVDAQTLTTHTYVEILVNADKTSTLNAKESDKIVFSADATAEGLKGTYKKYDANGNETESGSWDLLREDLSIVTLSFIQLYTPIDAIRDSLMSIGATNAGALQAAQHFGGSMVAGLEKYLKYFVPPPDATTSPDPIEGDRWSLVYYWDDLAYQVSTTPETYYHTAYVKNGEAWDTVCHAEDSKTMRSAEMFFVKDTLDTWDFTSHFELSLAQDGVSDLVHYVLPIDQAANNPGWQDYIITFKPETLAASDWRQIFNNAFGAFIWRVGNWTSGCSTGLFEIYAWPGPALQETLTWPSK